MIKSAHRINFFNPLIYTIFSVAAPTASIITILARSRGINGCQALIQHYHTQNLWNYCCGCFFCRCLFNRFGIFSCVSIQLLAKWFHNCFSYGQNIKVRYFSSPLHFQWMDCDVTVITTSIFLESEPLIYGYACVRLFVRIFQQTEWKIASCVGAFAWANFIEWMNRLLMLEITIDTRCKRWSTCFFYVHFHPMNGAVHERPNGLQLCYRCYGVRYVIQFKRMKRTLSRA